MVFGDVIEGIRKSYPDVYKGDWTFEQLEPYFKEKKCLTWRKLAFKYFYNRQPIENGYENFMYYKFITLFLLSVGWALLFMPIAGTLVIGIFTDGIGYPIAAIQALWMIIPIIVLWIPYAHYYGDRHNWNVNWYLKRYGEVAFEIDQAILARNASGPNPASIQTGLNILQKR